MYNDGHRESQDRFDSRRIADRLEQVTVHTELSDGDVAFIEASSMFFLATADGEGWPDVSYKGGRPGSVRCLDRRTIAFPRTTATFEQPGPAAVARECECERRRRAARFAEGAQAVVRVTVVRAFPNCPRYIHRMVLEELSVFAPAPGHQPPEPEWKAMEEFRDYLPASNPTER